MMKINWGTKLMLFFGAFVMLILFMVFKSTQQNTDLVAIDYYAREIAYQDRIDRQERLEQLEEEIIFKVNASELEISLPLNGSGYLPAGTLTFQRPSNQQLDRFYDIATDSSGKQLLSLNEFSSGLYNVQIEWQEGSVQFYAEKKLIVP